MPAYQSYTIIGISSSLSPFPLSVTSHFLSVPSLTFLIFIDMEFMEFMFFMFFQLLNLFWNIIDCPGIIYGLSAPKEMENQYAFIDL